MIIHHGFSASPQHSLAKLSNAASSFEDTPDSSRSRHDDQNKLSGLEKGTHYMEQISEPAGRRILCVGDASTGFRVSAISHQHDTRFFWVKDAI